MENKAIQTLGEKPIGELKNWLKLIRGRLSSAYNDLFVSYSSISSEIEVYNSAMLNQINRFDLLKSNLTENIAEDYAAECINILEDLNETLEEFYDYINRDMAHIEELIKYLSSAFEQNLKIIIIKINELNINIEQYLIRLDVSQNKLQKQIFNKIINNAKKEVKNVESATRAINGEKTEEVYMKAFNRYSKTAKNYEHAFYYACATSVISTIVVCIFIHFCPTWLYEIIAIKIILALVLITLITLFLRRLSHYRKLADEADQKSLELSALPSFMREVRKEDQEEIYKELAGKYFGAGVDHSQNDKVGDLIQDQAKMSIDIAKATTEMVKSLKDVKSDQDSKDSDSK